MKILRYIAFFLMFVNCVDNNEVVYEYKLTLMGDTSNMFSELGEERQFSVTCTSTPATSDKELETLLKSSEIILFSENDNFSFSDYTILGSSLNFKIICKENKNGNCIEDKVHIRISNSLFNLEITEGLKQASADIRYEYKIKADIVESYTIPAKGGTFNIPIQGKRLTYINDNIVLEEPYNLKGLRFVSHIVNTAWVHSTLLVSGESPGEYFIQLTAQPYNFEGESLWEVQFRFDDKVLYLLKIFHPQISGENYFMPYTKTFYESIIIDE